MRFVLAIAGAFIGSLFGMPGLGFAIGSMAGSLLFPETGPTMHGPRLSDLAVQVSTYGVPKPLLYATDRVAGNMIWINDNKIDETTHESGGGLFGGPKVVSYTYSVSCGVALGVREIGGIKKIYADKKLIYNNDYDQLSRALDAEGSPLMLGLIDYALDRQAENLGLKRIALVARFYTGTEDQTADPAIVADWGAADTPDFKDLVYVVFEDMELEDFGNRIPQFEFVYYTGAEVARKKDYEDSMGATAVYYDRPGGAYYNYDGQELAKTDSLTTEQIFKTTTLLSSPYDGVEHDFTANNIAVDLQGRVYTTVRDANDMNRSYIVRLNPDTGAIEKAFHDYRGSSFFTPALHFGLHGGMIPLLWAFSFTSPTVMVWIVTATGLSAAGSMLSGASPDGFPGGGVWIGGLCTDKRGDAWILRQVPFGPAYLYKITILIGNEAYMSSELKATFTPDAGYQANGMSYDPYSHRLVIDVNSGIHIFDIETEVVTQVPGLTTTVWGVDISTGPTDGCIWVHQAPYWAYKIDIATAAVVETFDMAAYTSGTVQALVYEPRDNSLNVKSASMAWDKIYLPRGESAPELLSTVLTDLCGRVKYYALDVSQLDASHIVRGYSVGGRQMTAREVIEPLLAINHVDAATIDGKLTFVPRGGASVVTLTEADLGATPAGSREPLPYLTEVFTQSVEIAARITVNYKSSDLAYEQNSQTFARSPDAVASVEHVVLDMPVVLTDDAAAQLVEVWLNTAWIERVPLEFSLMPEHRLLTPTDVLTLTRGNVTYTARILATDEGEGGVIKAKAVPTDGSTYVSDRVGVTPVRPELGIKLYATSRLGLFDMPGFTSFDADDGGGVYVMAWPDRPAYEWGGAVVYYSTTESGGYVDVKSIITAPGRGVTATALTAPPSVWTWDRVASLTVGMTSGVLASAAELDVLNGANFAIVGTVATGWEYIQWATAVDNGDGTYTLSDLLRGRKNTDYLGQQARGSGLEFFVVDPDLMTRRPAFEGYELERFYKVATIGRTSSPPALGFTYQGEDLKPPAGVSGAATRDGSNNLTVTWLRRSRFASPWVSVEPPLGEDSEAYEVDILDAPGGTVLRTIAGLATSSASYTAAEQTTDGLTPGDPVDLVIYQLSAKVGRGFAREVTL